MARKVLVNLDLNNNQILNFLVQLLASDPSSPAEGQMWYNSTSHQLKYRNNSATIVVAAGVTIDTTTGDYTSSAPGDATAAGSTGLAADAGHKHGRETTQTHTYISDFDTQVRTSRLDQMAAPTSDVSWNSHKITNLLDPTAAQDATTKNYVDNAIQGVTWKEAVQAATTAALAANTYANGASGVGATLTANANGAIANIDGYAVVAGDRLLVQNEATASHNGIYTATQLGDGTHPYILTRATDNDDGTEIAASAVFVLNGTTNGNQGFIVTSPLVGGTMTMGTTSITWTQFSGVAELTAGTGITISGKTVSLTTPVSTANGGTGSGTIAGARTNLSSTANALPQKYTATIGDGSTTAISVNHGLGTSDVVTSIYDASSLLEVSCDVTHTDANHTTFTFATAPASNAYKVVIIG